MKPKVILIVFSTMLGFIYSSRANLDAFTVVLLLPATVLLMLILVVSFGKVKKPFNSTPFRKLTKSEFLFCSVFFLTTGLAICFLTAFEIFDTTSLLISLPTIVLLILVLISAFQKGAFLPQIAPIKAVSYILGIGCACWLLSYLHSQFYWGETIHFRNSIERALGQCLSHETNIIITILCTVFVFYIVDLVLNFKRFSQGPMTDRLILLPVFRSAALAILLLYILPIFYFVFTNESNISENIGVVKDSYRLSISLSTIPASIMGIMSAFLGHTFKPRDLSIICLYICAPAILLPLTMYSVYPSHCQTFNGNFMEISGNYYKAIESLNSAIELDPRNSEAYISRARILGKMNRKNLALQDYKQALLLDPNNHQLLCECVTINSTTHQNRDSIDLCNKFISLNPRNHFAYSYRAFAYNQLNDNEKASNDFKKARELETKTKSNRI